LCPHRAKKSSTRACFSIIKEGTLAGTVLAQSCPNGDCPNNQSIVINLNGNSGGWLQWLEDLFSSLFGGGGSQPVILPGHHRHAHYPASQFIGVYYDLTVNMEDSFRRESSMGGRIIWVSQPYREYRKAPGPELRNGPPQSPAYNACNATNLPITGIGCVALGITCGSGLFFAPEDAPVAPGIVKTCWLAPVFCAGFTATMACCMHGAPEACNNPASDWSNLK
jgi:hypothetical protein